MYLHISYMHASAYNGLHNHSEPLSRATIFQVDYIWGISDQIELAVTLTIFDFFSYNMLKGVPKKYRSRSFSCFEKFFGGNIVQNNSTNSKWHCCMLSIQIKFGQWILSEKTNFLSHRRKWALLWFGIYETIKIQKKLRKAKIIENHGS